MKIRKYLPQLVFLAIVLALFAGYRIWKNSSTDSIAPVISFDPGVLEISVQDDRNIMLEGITVMDDCDGDVTASLMIEKIGVINDEHEFTVTYAAFDSAGNVTKARRTLRYTDYESPKFYLNAPLLYLPGREVEVVNRIMATDMIDGDISHRIKVTAVSEIPVTSEGVHDMLFRVTNSMGDTAELIIPAEVYPTGRYNADLLLSDYLVYIRAGETFDAKQYLHFFKHGDTSVFLGAALPEAYQLVTRGNVDTSIAGVYPVSYTLTYTKNNTVYTAYSKLIVIVEG